MTKPMAIRKPPEDGAELTAAISGSFKFKPEIDEACEQFRDYGVVVIAPDAGWLYLPRYQLHLPHAEDFRPLPTERHMSPGQVEDTFLEKVREADFLYLFNRDGYVGISASLELGFALGLRKPIYSLEPLNLDAMEIEDIGMMILLERSVRVKSIAEAAQDFREQYSQ